MRAMMKLGGVAVLGAILGMIVPMGCGKSEPSRPPLAHRPHYGEFGYLQGLDDDPMDRLLRGNEEIADEVHQIARRKSNSTISRDGRDEFQEIDHDHGLSWWY